MELVCKRFEELTTQELYGILYCRAEVFVVEQGIVYQDMDYKDLHSTHLFYAEHGRPVSYLRIIDAGIKYNEYSIGRVLTLKEYRGRRLSEALIRKAIALISEKPDPKIRIEAQAYLKGFYESLGFKAVSEVFILEDIPHVAMVYDPRMQEV